jgi:hypothetical protein
VLPALWGRRFPSSSLNDSRCCYASSPPAASSSRHRAALQISAHAAVTTEPGPPGRDAAVTSGRWPA